MTAALTQIVIVGRDVPLWLTALTLQRALRESGVTVTAIELPSRLRSATVLASLPALEGLHQRIGVDEADLLATTGGSLSLGWNVLGPGLRPFFLAHGSYGTSIGGDLFLPYWSRARAHGLDIAFDEFSPTAMAARFGRILVPDDETAMFGRTDYGYHLPAVAYAALLKSHAARSGVSTVQAVQVGIERAGDGSVLAVVADGRRVGGDLFVDASGEDLLADPPGPEHLASFDRMVTGTAPPFSITPPFAEVRLDPAGMLTLQSCRARTAVSFAYRGDTLDDDAAMERASALAGTTLIDADVQLVPTTGDRNSWTGNAVSIGDQRWSGPFDFALHSIQLSLVHLLAVFPTICDFAVERDEYNRVMRSSLARLCNVATLFEGLVSFDTAPWQRARMKALETPIVAHRIASFRARGEIPPLEDESLPLDFFQAMCVGLGVQPQTWTPAVDRLPIEQLQEEFRKMLSFIRSKVEQQPGHDAYLRSLGGAAAA